MAGLGTFKARKLNSPNKYMTIEALIQLRENGYYSKNKGEFIADEVEARIVELSQKRSATLDKSPTKKSVDADCEIQRNTIKTMFANVGLEYCPNNCLAHRDIEKEIVSAGGQSAKAIEIAEECIALFFEYQIENVFNEFQ